MKDFNIIKNMITKEINNSVSGEGVVSATTQKKDYAFDIAKFNLLMKHKTLEKFQDYIERVSVMTDGFKTPHKIAFDYEDDWREKWVDFITEKYGSDESVVKEAVNFYDDNEYLFMGDNIALVESEVYGNENGYIVDVVTTINDKIDYVNTFDIEPGGERLYVVGKLDVESNPIHRIAREIRDRVYAFEDAACNGIVKYDDNYYCVIPLDYFSDEDVEIIKTKWDGRRGCITDIFKKIEYKGLITGIVFAAANERIIVKYIWGK